MCVTVEVIDDDLCESREEFLLVASGGNFPDGSTATLAIDDNDGKLTATVHNYSYAMEQHFQ